ncbi:MAG: TrmH family RNA methyltransferase [Candidatus Gottesmanbacteria bacterium]
MKLNAQELRTQPVDGEVAKSIKKNPITIILDNVLDTYNIGSIFRLADAVAAEKVYLCGQTETPPNTRIKKASINTWQWVNWEYVPDTATLLKKLKSGDPTLSIVAVEQDARSVQYGSVPYSSPIAIVVGNETYGIAKDVLDEVDMIVELPMFGINTSLNVMVTTGIVLYDIVRQIKNLN